LSSFAADTVTGINRSSKVDMIKMNLFIGYSLHSISRYREFISLQQPANILQFQSTFMSQAFTRYSNICLIISRGRPHHKEKDPRVIPFPADFSDDSAQRMAIGKPDNCVTIRTGA
jgi:hypothetical protein